MKILVQDFSGHPFQAQLSRALAARGHDVLHTTCGGYASGHGALARQPGDPERLRFEAIEITEGFQKYRFRKRLVQELAYGRKLRKVIQRERPDVFLSCNEPLLAKAVAGAWCWRHRVRWVFWLQDLYSVAMRRELTRLFGSAGSGVGRVLEALERWLVRRADGVVLISHAFEGWLLDHGINEPNIAVIPNWAPLDELPYYPDDQGWFQHIGVPAGAPVALYSGTLGRKHDATLFGQLAEHLVPSGGHVVVISEGPAADLLAEEAAGHLPNLHVLPFQPWEELPYVLGSASVLLAVLAPEAAAFSVPSKVLTYLCAGRPIVASVTSTNLAAEHIREAAAGAVTEPDDDGAFVGAVEGLLSDPDRCRWHGANARQWAEHTFDIDDISKRFEDVLEHAAHPAARAVAT